MSPARTGRKPRFSRQARASAAAVAASARRAQFSDFDENTSPVNEAVLAVQRDDLVALFTRLEKADDAFSADPPAAALAALRAMIDFAACPVNANGRFTRTMELLWLELSNARCPRPGNILPLWDTRQSPERAKRQAVNYLKGAAAYTADQLSDGVRTVDKACQVVADLLRECGFPFAAKRMDNEWKTVKAWRRDFQAKWDFEAKTSPAALAYQEFFRSPPVPTSSIDYGSAVLVWLESELERAGYEPHQLDKAG